MPADTGRKLNVHKAFRKRPQRLLNVLCTFNLRPVSTGMQRIIFTSRRLQLRSNTIIMYSDTSWRHKSPWIYPIGAEGLSKVKMEMERNLRGIIGKLCIPFPLQLAHYFFTLSFRLTRFLFFICLSLKLPFVNKRAYT